MDIRYDLSALGLALDEVERRRWLFDNLPIDPLHRDWLCQRAWVCTVHGTTRIEGNTLSGLEVERLLDGVGSKALPRKDALEILGTRSALELADQIAADASVDVDQSVVRELHRRILDRQSPLLTPGELMRAFTEWIAANRSLPTPLLAALTHLEFVAIHPFNDGNGRTARALARLLLVRGGYTLSGLLSLDALLDTQRSTYFAAIRASIGDHYHQPYEATPFASYFLVAIAAAADHVLGRLRGLGEVQVKVRRDVVESRLQPAMLDALAFAFINRSVRAGDYAKITGRTPASTTRDLAGAVKLGYLVAEGTTRDRWYRLGPKLLETPAPGEPSDPREDAPRA